MPRVPVHTVDDAPAASREALSSLQARYGKVLNIYGEIAHSPALLSAYGAFNKALSDQGSLDGRTREAIALAVGAANSCDYCQSAHTLGGKAAGLSVEQTVAIRSGHVDFDPKLAALVAVVREAASNVGYVDDATWNAAVEAGWSDTELLEAFGQTVANVFTNYFNHFVGTELDLPLAPGL